MSLLAHCQINDNTAFFSDEEKVISLYLVKDADNEVRKLTNTLNRILKERGFPEKSRPDMTSVVAYTDKKTSDDLYYSDTPSSSNVLSKNATKLGKNAVGFYDEAVLAVIKDLESKIAFQRRCKKNSKAAKHGKSRAALIR